VVTFSFRQVDNNPLLSSIMVKNTKKISRVDVNTQYKKVQETYDADPIVNARNTKLQIGSAKYDPDRLVKARNQINIKKTNPDTQNSS